MAVYLLNLCWVFIMSIFAVKFSKVKYNEELKIDKKLPNIFFVVLILFSMMTIYALRWKTGTDFGSYYHYFFNYGKMNIRDLIGTRDWGFYSLTSIIYKIWPDNFILYNYILSAFTYIPVILTLRKYSSDFTFTNFLYITMMTYYWPFNGVRQSIACSICFSAYPLLYDRKYVKYLFFILAAYLFHSTALLMIPVMFIATKKAWSKPVTIAFSILILALIFLPGIWNNIIALLKFIGQDKMANDYSRFNYADNGANILRVIVALVPIIIAFIFYKQLKQNNTKIDIFINMSLLYSVFMIFAYKQTIFARISDYFVFFNALLIPEFSSLFKGKDRVLFKYVTASLFFVYMLMLLPTDSNLLPYQFIFNH